jgi:hypothetical protein
MIDATAEKRKVTIDARFAKVEAALDAVARAAKLEVIREGDVTLVRRPLAPAAPKVIETEAHRWRAPDLFTYPVAVLRADVPEDVTLGASLRGFEGRAGFGLVVEPTLKETTVRSYLEGRDAFREILRREKIDIDLRGDVDGRSVRIYVEPARKHFYSELTFSSGAEVAHFVFRLDAEQSCEALYIFTVAPVR